MKKKQKKQIPNPGTEEALALGCKCPVLDNNHGRGCPGLPGHFFYNEDCEVHAGIINSIRKEY